MIDHSEEQSQQLPHLTVEESLNFLVTSINGLSLDEAQRRLTQHGQNVLLAQNRFSLIQGVFRHFTHFLAALLWIAAGLSFAAEMMQPGQGMATLGWAIVAVIVINATFAFIQEYKAERAVQALRDMLPEKAWVTRGGLALEVSRSDIVVGDILMLEEGERVPADARLIEAAGMRVDNAALTGESNPTRRTAQVVTDGHWLELANLVFAGTTILSGHGRAVVFATGMRSEFGKIAHLTSTIEASLSPLQKEIIRATHIVAMISLVMGTLFFAMGLWTGLGFWSSAIFGIGIIVANVPEGLLPTVTLALAMSSQRMAKRKALVKHLPAVETLGCTTVICTDKTGTLTENRMTVDRFYVDGVVIDSHESSFSKDNRSVTLEETEQWRLLFDALLHCNNAKRVRQSNGSFILTGDPTEVALLQFAIDHELAQRPAFQRMGELAFDADRKRMSTIHWIEGRLVAFVKGAPESILELCTHILLQGKPVVMTPEGRQRILSQSRSFAEQAYRVLAVACREVVDQPEHIEVDSIETELTFLGLVAMIDPPHREVRGAIATCGQAGIRVVMITGDHGLTALAIGRKIGLVPESVVGLTEQIGLVVEGSQLDKLSDNDLRCLLTPCHTDHPAPIFARMAPRHKMRVVTILKEMGEVVAVTGDGVNDAPALKKADIGIAMGMAGTDVAKEIADIILLDDNFATIVSAIEEGRAVFENIRKFTTYVLVSNVPEVVPYLCYGFLGAPLALTIPQVLAVDLGTDMVPAIALGIEPPQPGLMNISPRPRTEGLLTLPLLLRTYLFLGLNSAMIAMGAFFLYLYSSGWTWEDPLAWSSSLYKEATTVTLAGIVLAQIANVFACRSDRRSIFQIPLFSNSLILWGIFIEVLLLAAITYTTFGNQVFGTAPLPAWIFAPLALGAVILLSAEEMRKYVARLLGGRGRSAQAN